MGRRRIPKGVEAGPWTYFGGRPKILWDRYGSKLIVGSHTSISAGVTIFLGGEHHTDRVATGKVFGRIATFSKGGVTIGSDVWIGHGAVILSGVTIGDGVVIGAFTVVASDVDPYAVVAGNPARKIRDRFSPDQIRELLRIKWWDWPPEKIARFSKLLKGTDVDEFIRRAKE